MDDRSLVKNTAIFAWPPYPSLCPSNLFGLSNIQIFLSSQLFVCVKVYVDDVTHPGGRRLELNSLSTDHFNKEEKSCLFPPRFKNNFV